MAQRFAATAHLFAFQVDDMSTAETMAIDITWPCNSTK
jgi:hypothetical protein